MSEQEYNISSPLPFSLFSEDFSGEYNNETDNNDEFFEQNNSEYELFSMEELFINIYNDNTDDSDSSFEDFQNDTTDSEDFQDDFEEIKRDDIIDDLEQTRFTPCVIIDFVGGKIQRCGESGKLRQLSNLFGTWQVDREVIKEVNCLSKLGVCNSHFQFDNKYLHKSQNKQLKHFNEGVIQWRRCISCNKYVTFFSRGVGCTLHSWHLNKQNIQVPCIGQYTCEALRSYLSLCKRAFDDIKKPLCICCSCYENLGGHIYHRPGQGKRAKTCATEKLHDNDTTKGLEYLGNWLINIAQIDDNEIKKNILKETFRILLPFTLPFNQKFTNNTTIPITNISTSQEKIPLNELPSLFMIKVLFMETSKKEKVVTNYETNDFEQFGHEFGQKLWNSRSDINLKKFTLESPQTIQEYYDSFPKFLNSFFFGVIDELYQRKIRVCNKQRKKHEQSPKTINSEQTIKVVTFITSILLRLAFPHLKVWLPQVLTSLSRIPRLLGSFRQILTICHVTSHTDRHERKLAKMRMEKSNPTSRLIRNNNIWNLAVIDNIDFKEKSFKFGNIYDVTRGNSHATLRMAFQAQLPFEVETGPEPTIELTAETPLFGMNQSINEILMLFQEIICELLDFKKINDELVYRTDFDAEVVKHVILTRIDHGCPGPSPNIVILQPGANPNSDEEILRVAEAYKEDFELENHSFLDIVADEAIFRRLIKCREKWPNLRPLLGQWHTSKDFCSVLLVLFSSYGLLSLASRLGVRFLDKFEAVIDYRSTARVLDLLWVAVAIAINIYITKKGILFSEIMDGKNDTNICLKIWYMYYKWAGIWKAHRIGMRVGNFDLQRNSLSAAGPLYASAAKSNYTTAITHFLSTIAAYPKLEEKLRYCSAFKIPNEDRHVCFGFDEALETFGVRFIKQNVSGNVIDETNLNNQIKASQDERERIDLLMSEYLNDHSVSHSERAVNSRKESLWELVNNLVIVFGMDDPLSHQLFQNYTPTQMHPEGLDRLIACYPDGLERIKEVYRQEVLGIENRNTKGRRATGVVRMKFKDYNSQKKRKHEAEKKINLTKSTRAENSNKAQPSVSGPSTDCLPDSIEPQPKRRKTIGTRHRTTEDEMAILSTLKIYEDKLPDNAIASVREQLSEIWTIKKVREWWNYHKNK